MYDVASFEGIGVGFSMLLWMCWYSVTNVGMPYAELGSNIYHLFEYFE